MKVKVEKVEKVGKAELLALAPGESKVFILPTGLKKASAQAQTYKMPILYPRKGILRYSFRTPKKEEGYPDYALQITAIRNDE